ncbi:glutamate--cysteine ligase [Glaciecola sp. 1036]|uniref:glutamate--cysteine ligase n=1 Tax=Alteromonadaceae TaxID=72275 RepID=UPI003D077A05
MTSELLMSDFSHRLSLLDNELILKCLPNIRHGVERETLRVNDNGTIATTSHPAGLGSALKHEWITTDFSESLLEFITPPETDIDKTIGQLVDIHKFVCHQIGEELLWPLSMPCFVNASTNIPIARYGKSNIAKMKETYRNGLHHRYGSVMQVISGVHLNFSMPDEFWQPWLEQQGKKADKDSISSEYFAIIRNFRRNAWLVPYLFGASPALCSSFIAHRDTQHPFEKLGKGTLYLPYATSLRMSDLGYTSSAQSGLRICYDSLDNYVKTLRKAISLPAPEYKDIPTGQDGKWHQLNDNILQIENELYAPVRPKQVANYLEKPTDALANRGVSYIEIRGLDVNPYSQVGIDAHQIKFMDAFLLACLVMPSPGYSDDDHERSKLNMNRVVLEGRKPGLELETQSGPEALSSVASTLFDYIAKAAEYLDKVNNTNAYSDAVKVEKLKVDEPEQTYSGRLLSVLKAHDIDNSGFGLSLSKEYKSFFMQADYRYIQKAEFEEETSASVLRQVELEKQDSEDFDTFVTNYFADKQTENA